MNKFRLVTNIVVPIALGWLVFNSRDQIADTLISIGDLPLLILALHFPIQFISYLAVAQLYYSHFKQVGLTNRLSPWEMYKISLELNFINGVFPSGGLSGFSYLSLRLRPLGVPFAASTFAQGLRYFLTFVSYMPILGIGLLLLIFAGDPVDYRVILVGVGIFVGTVGGAILAWHVISSELRIKRLVAFLPRLINFISRRFRSGRAELIEIARVERVLGEIHIDYLKIKQNPRQLLMPFWWAIVVNLMELATVYTVFWAFGELINPGALVLAYAVANFAGLIVVLPGGIGGYEALMAGILILAGVPGEVAISATLVYRIVNIFVFIPFGFWFYWLAGKDFKK